MTADKHMGPLMHRSDCAVFNAPALPVGPCNCGGWYGDPQWALDEQIEAQVRAERRFNAGVLIAIVGGFAALLLLWHFI